MLEMQGRMTLLFLTSVFGDLFLDLNSFSVGFTICTTSLLNELSNALERFSFYLEIVLLTIIMVTIY